MVSFKDMEFADSLIEDLKKRKAKIQNCGYYNLNIDEKVTVIQSNQKSDLNINFGTEIPKDKIEGTCNVVEVEVFGGIPEIYGYDVTLFYNNEGRVVVKHYRSLTSGDKKSLKEYMKKFGVKEIIFERL